jgi:hypothetical protein
MPRIFRTGAKMRRLTHSKIFRVVALGLVVAISAFQVPKTATAALPSAGWSSVKSTESAVALAQRRFAPAPAPRFNPPPAPRFNPPPAQRFNPPPSRPQIQQNRQQLIQQQRQRIDQHRAQQQQKMVQMRQQRIQQLEQLKQTRLQERQALEKRRELLKSQQTQLRDQRAVKERVAAERVAKDKSASIRSLTAVGLLATGAVLAPRLQERLEKLSGTPSETPPLKTDEQHRKDLQGEGKLGIARPAATIEPAIAPKPSDKLKEKLRQLEAAANVTGDLPSGYRRIVNKANGHIEFLAPNGRVYASIEEAVAANRPPPTAAVASGGERPAPPQLQANWGTLNHYRHGGLMTAIEHINYRHGFDADLKNVGRFAKETSIRNIQSYVDDALRYGQVTVIEDGFRIEHNLGQIVGTDAAGNATSNIRVFVRGGNIQTAFPF